MANGLQIDFLMAGVMGTNNKPLAYGKVWCYGSGGSSLQSVYTDATLTTEATNPVILDERGSANVYASGYYKFVIMDKNDVTIETYDNLYYVIPSVEVTDVVTITADYTASATNEIISCNTAGASIEITLPSANDNEGLRKLIYKTSGSNTLTITPDGADTINGDASKSMTVQYDYMELISDGADWLIINSNVTTGGTVTTSSTDTLSNKSLVDSSTYIVDNVDNTKKIQFQVSSVTTGNTRTLTVPNADGTLATLAGTENFTNKTITAPVLSGTVTGTYTLGGTGTISSPTITVIKNSIAKAYRGTADQSLTTGVTSTIEFNAEVFDVGSNFASYTYTAPSTGYYRIHGQIMFISSGTIVGGIVTILVNGTDLKFTGMRPGSGTSCYVPFTTTTNLNATDTVIAQATLSFSGFGWVGYEATGSETFICFELISL